MNETTTPGPPDPPSTTERGTVEQRVRITAPPEVVWSYWIDPDRLRRWWGTATLIEPEPDGRFRVSMGEGAPTMSGRFLVLDPPHRLVFTFGWEPSSDGIANRVPPGSTRVEVDFVPAGSDTELVLRHIDLPVGEVCDRHREGWAHFAGEALGAAIADGSAA